MEVLVLSHHKGAGYLEFPDKIHTILHAGGSELLVQFDLDVNGRTKHMPYSRTNLDECVHVLIKDWSLTVALPRIRK